MKNTYNKPQITITLFNTEETMAFNINERSNNVQTNIQQVTSFSTLK